MKITHIQLAVKDMINHVTIPIKGGIFSLNLDDQLGN